MADLKKHNKSTPKNKFPAHNNLSQVNEAFHYIGNMEKTPLSSRNSEHYRKGCIYLITILNDPIPHISIGNMLNPFFIDPKQQSEEFKITYFKMLFLYLMNLFAHVNGLPPPIIPESF